MEETYDATMICGMIKNTMEIFAKLQCFFLHYGGKRILGFRLVLNVFVSFCFVDFVFSVGAALASERGQFTHSLRSETWCCSVASSRCRCGGCPIHPLIPRMLCYGYAITTWFSRCSCLLSGLWNGIRISIPIVCTAIYVPRHTPHVKATSSATSTGRFQNCCFTAKEMVWAKRVCCACCVLTLFSIQKYFF